MPRKNPDTSVVYAQNTESPPSTIAAQIVNRLSVGNGQRTPDSRDKGSLQQLLDEILSHDETQDSSPLDEDLLMNSKMVCVIARAGLDPLLHDAVSSGQLEGPSQMVTCLEVIDLVIRKSPGILLAKVDDNLLGIENEGTITLWLLPKLVGLLCRFSSHEMVHQKAKQALSTIVLKSSRLFQQRQLVSDIRHILQSFVKIAKNDHSLDSFKLQDDPLISKLPAQSKLEVERALSLVRTFQEMDSCISLIQVCIQSYSDQKHNLSTIFERRNNWSCALNNLQNLWVIYSSKNSHFATQRSSNDNLLMNFVKALLLLLEDFNLITTFATHSYFRLTAGVFRSAINEPNQELQICLHELLDRIFGIVQGQIRLVATYVDFFRPILVTVKTNDDLFRSLTSNLQDSISAALDPLKPTTVDAQTCVLEERGSDPILRDVSKPTDVEALSYQRSRKRRRLSRDDENPKIASNKKLEERIFSLLNLQGSKDLSGLSAAALKSMEILKEEEQCSAINLIGQLACSSANSGSPGFHSSQCIYCDSDSPEQLKRVPLDGNNMNEIFHTITNFLESFEMLASVKVRIELMLVIGRLVNHATSSQYLSLSENFPYGKFCLQSLRSPTRELRIAAGRALKSFCYPGVGLELSRDNASFALDFLNKVCETNDPSLQETSILALTNLSVIWISSSLRLTKVALDSYPADRELGKSLQRLVEFLGSSNSLISGLCLSGLQILGQTAVEFVPGGVIGGVPPHHVGLRVLFLPYWSTLALTAVNGLQSRPQIIMNLSDALGMSVSGLLSLTQSWTLPHLVFTKKNDILQKIAQSKGSERSVGAMCSERTNMAVILAYLLLQPSDEPERTILEIMGDVSSAFNGEELSSLVRTIPTDMAAELLKYSGDDEREKKDEVSIKVPFCKTALKHNKVNRALQLLSTLAFGKTTQEKPRNKKTNYIGQFFDTHILGIMALFSGILNDFLHIQPLPTKRQCLRAIGEVVKFGKSHISNALPQISACLRSAIQVEGLCDDAFRAWVMLVVSLRKGDVEPFIDQTFALIAHSWSSFSSETMKMAVALVEHLFEKHGETIYSLTTMIPSLTSVPGMSKFEEDLEKQKARIDTKLQLQAYTQRLNNENGVVVEAAFKELALQLKQHQDLVHESVVNARSDSIAAELTRAILDATVRFSEERPDIAGLSGKCLGYIGCLDPNKIESIKESKDIIVLSNFEDVKETLEFVFVFLEEVLVNVFLLTSNTKLQGFLSFAMQELLKFCELGPPNPSRAGSSQNNYGYHRWIRLPESIRNTLEPFRNSKYTVTVAATTPESYPLFRLGMSYADWLRRFALDMLQKAEDGSNVGAIFLICGRIIRGQDLSIPNFLLPFATLNVVVNGSEDTRKGVAVELRNVLQLPMSGLEHSEKEQLILSSESVFQVLDYITRWVQDKKKQVRKEQSRSSIAYATNISTTQIQHVENTLAQVPAEVISQRAVECKSFSRALFHWEQYIRQEKAKKSKQSKPESLEPLYERLQDIYTQIDEPDGIEGISANLHVLNVDQQILEHRKAGRWTAAQSWYELMLNEEPENVDIQVNLLSCLKDSGQHDVLLNQFDRLQQTHSSLSRTLPYAAEASWVTSKWDKLGDCITRSPSAIEGDFNVAIGSALVALHNEELLKFSEIVAHLRQHAAKSLTATNTASFQACHEIMLRLQVLTEIEEIVHLPRDDLRGKETLLGSLDRRLDVMGAFLTDKQYVLGLRRAAMRLSPCFQDTDIAASWLTSARLARKGEFKHQAFSAVLHAAQLGDDSATIEQARLLWGEGHHRKAIQTLEGAIESNAFGSHNRLLPDDDNENHTRNTQEQNYLTARAYVLLGKWMDRAGQTRSDFIIKKYKTATKMHSRWEKGFYYLGKHYNKILESERAKQPDKQDERYIGGEMAKHVIDNYLKAISFGSKYVYQTVPRILTLWLDLGSAVDNPISSLYGNPAFRQHIKELRKRQLKDIHSLLKKKMDNLPGFVFYTALTQIVARICHENESVYLILRQIIVKVVSAHPQQALWALLAVVKSSSSDRRSRGGSCLQAIPEHIRKTKGRPSSESVLHLINQGQRLVDYLLRACEADVDMKYPVSLSKHLGFNHKIAPCRLVIPLEHTLNATLPMGENVNILTHRAFPPYPTTIALFLDEVLVLKSLARPRKIMVRGSDGRVHGLLCKPKDDLRKDQRLMAFNSMITRLLRRDTESSKRRLYIKTYAVTPLNEECGLIEWVNNLKTLREILLKKYDEKAVHINYREIQDRLNEGCRTDDVKIFTDDVLPRFPSVFHEWFVEMFPEPSSWFSARLKYTRSCAVMSMVGVVLGLGDRHGENILFEEDTGGTFHVDFNCLFDKGQTFAKPEKVPFRLTHNMVDAFGAYGIDGPFRKCCELTMRILRQNEDTLMTILETFLYDPTTDFMPGKKKHGGGGGGGGSGGGAGWVGGIGGDVPSTPEQVLESVRGKVRGFVKGESMPLNVEGFVNFLINMATDQGNLMRMYVGWCAFF
ncbi:MAG: serine/threonine-protein kinase M1 [Cirrosporium novae-zelandiae]|nr:MAG: serine/threonine-protein kinase M1 [Cirrosporium novae-zelandiae]